MLVLYGPRRAPRYDLGGGDESKRRAGVEFVPVRSNGGEANGSETSLSFNRIFNTSDRAIGRATNMGRGTNIDR